MLWIGLYLPQLALDVFCLPETPGLPRSDWIGPSGYRLADGPCLAIVDRLQVLLANAAARAHGVHPGQKRATALALCPDLIVRERDCRQERQSLRQIACWALQFTPRLSLREPDERDPTAGLLLDIEASLALFGGLDRILTRIRLDLRTMGFSAQTGCAPTATASWLFARWRDGFAARTDAQLPAGLADLPVALLQGLQGREATVESIGVRTFRDLVQLPRNGLARRFGKGVLHEMDMALGKQPEVLPWFAAPLQFASTLELLADIDNAQVLVFAARRLLVELCGWLRARHATVRHFVLEARHDRTGRRNLPPLTPIDARFATPTDDPERMTGLLRERLATTTLAAPVHALHLRCEEITSGGRGEATLFPGPASVEESLGRLVERLQARLGHDQVQRILITEDHRPEAAYRIEPIVDSQALIRGTTLPGPALVPGSIPRPLWLLQQPIALKERQQRPWWQGPLKLLAGPERIEGGWWDNHLVQRDYFIAESDQAQWVWIYRTRGTAPRDEDDRSPGRRDDGAPSHRSRAGDERDDEQTTGSVNRWFLQGIFG